MIGLGFGLMIGGALFGNPYVWLAGCALMVVGALSLGD